MSKIRLITLLTLFLALVLLSGLVDAQPNSGSRSTPSASGGTVGSPGMSGAAVNAGTQQPSSGFSGSGANATGGSGRGGGGQSGGRGGEGGGRGGAQGGTTGNATGGNASSGQFTFSGGGFTPPSGEGGLQARFGQRGSGNLSFTVPQPGEGRTWPSIGGFGAPTQGGSTGSSSGTMQGTPWLPQDAPAGVPAAPAAYDDLSGMITAAQAASQGAADQAQAAYDQFWDDYYAAVETTAQTYYDTVTASSDTMLQTYQEAVNYTTDAIDYYVAYAEQFAAYCAAYPWDCYSYSYDAATNTYNYVGDVSDAPVSTTTLGAVTATDYLVQPTPAPSADAYQAIVVFANDQLGAVVEPLYAGEATDAVQAILQYLPSQMQGYVSNAAAISGASYGALLDGGAAAVEIGDCSSGSCSINADNLSVQLSSSSLGAYGLLADTAVPATPQDALALITQVYPKLDGLAFAQITDIDQGMAFTATAASIGYDANSQQPVSVAKVVYAGVVAVSGKPLVYALVAVGEGYVAIVAS